MRAVKVDGLIVDEETGEILEGHLDLDSLIARARSTHEQLKSWEHRYQIFKAMIQSKLEESGDDRYKCDYGTVSKRSTESIDRNALPFMQQAAELTDDQMNAVLLSSIEKLNVARFREMAHKVGVDVMDIERVIRRSQWVDVRGTVKEAPPIDEIEWR